MNYFLQVQAIVRLACETQQHINKLLGREYPNHPFDAADIDIHNLLQGREARKIPYLTNELEEIFKLGIVITKDSIEITEVDFV
jgi:disulfide oxidoreductase YuzD